MPLIDLHHPAFRSVVLPFFVALLGTGALRFIAGRRWAAAGLGLALLVAAVWTLGWRAPASVTEKYPWLVAAAWLVGIALEASKVGMRMQWIATSLLWAALLAWLGGQPVWWHGALTWLVGCAVIAAVLFAATQVRAAPDAARDSAAAPTLLVAASAGLAAVAMLSDSLLLFELALALTAALGGVLLWLWPTPRIAFGAAGSTVGVVAWLALAQGTALLAKPPCAAMLLLAGVSSSDLLLRAITGNRAVAPWARTLLLGAIALAWAAAAAGVAFWLGASGATDIDDPYYQPDW